MKLDDAPWKYDEPDRRPSSMGSVQLPDLNIPPKDERIAALEAVVQLERAHEHAARDAKELQQKANKIGTELANARIKLHKLLDVTDNKELQAKRVAE